MTKYYILYWYLNTSLTKKICTIWHKQIYDKKLHTIQGTQQSYDKILYTVIGSQQSNDKNYIYTIQGPQQSYDKNWYTKMA